MNDRLSDDDGTDGGENFDQSRELIIGENESNAPVTAPANPAAIPVHSQQNQRRHWLNDLILMIGMVITWIVQHGLQVIALETGLAHVIIQRFTIAVAVLCGAEVAAVYQNDQAQPDGIITHEVLPSRTLR